MIQSSFNQTAYRVLRLLLWLYEGPLTFQQINERFQSEPNVGKPLSQDTLWLYLNTLKVLGCQISRPMPSNGFCYILEYHPFAYQLTENDLDVLKHTLYTLDECQDYWDVINFNQFLQSMFEKIANKNRETLATQFFGETRTIPYEGLEELTRVLEDHAKNHHLLKLRYQSKETIFLPQKLFHHQNVVYVLGHTSDKQTSSMLRLDRIRQMTVIEDSKLRHMLLQKQLEKQTYLIRVFNCSRKQYDLLGEEDEIFSDPSYNEHLFVKFQADNPFLLRQKLLSSGHRFQVFYPETFRIELNQTLYEMRQLYV